MDVKTAFLNGDIDTEIYISQPQSFIVVGKEHLVYRLRKALYGLRSGTKKIDTWLRSQGFRKGIGDYNLYVINEGERILLLVLYVDDLLFTSNDGRWASWFKI